MLPNILIFWISSTDNCMQQCAECVHVCGVYKRILAVLMERFRTLKHSCAHIVSAKRFSHEAFQGRCVASRHLCVYQAFVVETLFTHYMCTATQQEWCVDWFGSQEHVAGFILSYRVIPMSPLKCCTCSRVSGKATRTTLILALCQGLAQAGQDRPGISPTLTLALCQGLAQAGQDRPGISPTLTLALCQGLAQSWAG